jgi:hypothetical protein
MRFKDKSKANNKHKTQNQRMVFIKSPCCILSLFDLIINKFLNLILNQISNKIIKKIAKFQIFILIFKNPNANSQFLFNFNKISGGNL